MTLAEKYILLKEYSRWLEEHGYLDSDWREETPTAVYRFLDRDSKEPEEKVLLG